MSPDQSNHPSFDSRIIFPFLTERVASCSNELNRSSVVGGGCGCFFFGLQPEHSSAPVLLSIESVFPQEVQNCIVSLIILTMYTESILPIVYHDLKLILKWFEQKRSPALFY